MLRRFDIILGYDFGYEEMVAPVVLHRPVVISAAAEEWRKSGAKRRIKGGFREAQATEGRHT